MYWTLSTFCHLFLLHLPLLFLSHSLLFFMSIYLFRSSFLYLFLYFSAPPLSPRHPGQLFIQTGCQQLSVQSWVAALEVGCIACSVELVPHTSVSSVHSIYDPCMTLNPNYMFSSNPHTHTALSILEEMSLQKMYWINIYRINCYTGAH